MSKLDGNLAALAKHEREHDACERCERCEEINEASDGK